MLAVPDVEAYETEIAAALAVDREWLARAIYRDAFGRLSEDQRGWWPFFRQDEPGRPLDLRGCAVTVAKAAIAQALEDILHRPHDRSH